MAECPGELPSEIVAVPKDGVASAIEQGKARERKEHEMREAIRGGATRAQLLELSSILARLGLT
ncbi:MAG: hypothetical protein WA418_35210 [Bradyrhizobium sp.]